VGIDVTDNKEVTFNNSHQNLLDTSTSKNPSIKRRHGLIIQSVFRRKRHRGHTQDGNPLIHALKGNHAYSINKQEIVKFLPYFYEIIDKALNEKDYNLILPLPSSHRINEYFARRILRKCPEATIEQGFLEKKTVHDVISDLESLVIPSNNLKKEVRHLLNQLNKAPAGKHFSMKDVRNHRLRKIIQPIKLANNLDIKANRVLLVDDLLASGTTLLTAYNLLKSKDIDDISAICLFSGLN